VGPDDVPNNGNGIVAARIIAGTNDTGTAIDAYGYCRYVSNNSTNAIFIPFRTYTPEWQAFFQHTPDLVALNDCSRGGQVPIAPNFGSGAQTNQCVGSPIPPDQNITAPFALYTAASPPQYTPATPVDFPNCISSDGTGFDEQALPTLAGFDSGAGPSTTPGWNVSSVAYTYDGLCGDAVHDAPSSTAPTNDLCHVGINTAVVLTGGSPQQWTWTCLAGNGGGTPAICYAPYQPAGGCGADQGVASVNGPWIDGPDGLCVSGSATSENHTTGSGATWTWDCTGGYHCTAPIAMPTFVSGCAVVQKDPNVPHCESDLANVANRDFCMGAGIPDGNDVFVGVGFICTVDPTVCEGGGCRTQWDVGDWIGDSDVNEYNNSTAPTCTNTLSGGKNWAIVIPPRFTFEWSGDLPSDDIQFGGSLTQEALTFGDVPNSDSKYKESVTVTDTYTGGTQTLGVTVLKQTTSSCGGGG